MQRQAQTLLVDVQGELPLSRTPRQQPVAEEVIHACKTFLDAFNLAVNVSGLEEKEIYLPLKIEASHWSRMRKGEVHFPLNKLDQLCDLTGNEIPLAWWAWRRGKGLVVLESESQRLLRLEQERAAKLAEENRLLRDLVQGRAVV